MARARGFAVSIGAVAVSAGIGLLLLQPLRPGAGIRFLLFVPPFLVAALVGGFLPALLATLLGAFLADVVYSLPVRVTGFASEPALAERLALEPSGYEGPTGIVGVLAERLRADGVEVVSFWAGLPHYIEASPNPRGTLALVQKAALHLGMPVEDAPLPASAAEFEETRRSKCC